MSTVPSSFTGIEERPEKIHPRHLDRLAMVYIRQSSMAQVQRNQESTKLQYSLVQTGEHLGWARNRIVIIDEDQGISGRSAEDLAARALEQGLAPTS